MGDLDRDTAVTAVTRIEAPVAAAAVRGAALRGGVRGVDEEIDGHGASYAP